MIVVRVYMRPGGDEKQERLLSTATFACVGQATEDVPALGVRKGERVYRVRLLKDAEFGGPKTDQDDVHLAQVWREDTVRGHMPGPRGVWDLVGGALRVMLGSRLSPYVQVRRSP